MPKHSSDLAVVWLSPIASWKVVAVGPSLQEKIGNQA